MNQPSRLIAAAVAALALGSRLLAQDSVQGKWSQPFPQIPFLGHTPAHLIAPFRDGGLTGFLVHSEIGHACLIPPGPPGGPAGPFAGKVLVWDRQEFVSFVGPSGYVEYPVTRKVWVVDPMVTPPSVTEIAVPDGHVATSIFCYGVTWTPSGKLVVAGADLTASSNSSFLFDPMTAKFHIGPSSHRARFYPTLTVLPSGVISMVGGRDETQVPALKFDEWELLQVRGTTLSTVGIFVPPLADQSWTPLGTPATYPFDYYPRTYTINDPAGLDRLFIANDVVRVEDLGNPPPVKASYTYRGSDQRLRIHDGALSSDAAPSADRRYGSAVMMCQIRPQNPALPMTERVFTMCGSNQVLSPEPGAGYPALNTFEEFVNLETGQWVRHLPAPGLVPERRVWQNAVQLPDGGVFVVGGSSVDSEFPQLANCDTDGFTAPPCPYFAQPVMTPELFYPPGASGPGSPLRLVKAPPQAMHRLYHAVAILLPDGRVMSLGSDDRIGAESPVAPGTESIPWPGNTAEIYSPPYKFQGVSGRIVNAPEKTTYGAPPFTMEVEMTPGPAFPTETFVGEPDSRVILMKCGAVTHHQDYDSRLVELSVRQAVALGGGRYRLTVDSPSAANRGAVPAGWYMTFVRTPKSKVPLGSGFLHIQ